MLKCSKCGTLNNRLMRLCVSCKSDLADAEDTQPQVAKWSFRKILGPVVLLIGVAMPLLIAYEYFLGSKQFTPWELFRGLLLSCVLIATGVAWTRGQVAG